MKSEEGENAKGPSRSVRSLADGTGHTATSGLLVFRGPGSEAAPRLSSQKDGRSAERCLLVG